MSPDTPTHPDALAAQDVGGDLQILQSTDGVLVDMAHLKLAGSIQRRQALIDSVGPARR